MFIRRHSTNRSNREGIGCKPTLFQICIQQVCGKQEERGYAFERDGLRGRWVGMWWGGMGQGWVRSEGTGVNRTVPAVEAI